ncbi:MAG: hypothetical protein KY464_14530 [Gemmatimonadetes bacterium]|nr:hypothetical protein [Gemmatimonadota bacterium]
MLWKLLPCSHQQRPKTMTLGTALIVKHAASIKDSLQVRGVVLLGAGLPIVLVAVDRLGIGNGANLA